MFEAAVIIILFLWAGIIFLFTGFLPGLFFACLLIAITLFWLAFLVVNLKGVMAGAPIITYASVIIGIPIFIKYLADPSSLRRTINAIRHWADTRQRTRIPSRFTQELD